MCLQIFNGDSMLFQKLPEIVNRYLVAPDPILLHYTINPAVTPPERPSAWDVEIKMEDLALKSRMAVMVHTNKESSQSLSKLDEEVCFPHLFIFQFPSIARMNVSLT
jgi:SWI/SNF-related matrix-associated actin-dependent regulator of chromatin subfamily D